MLEVQKSYHALLHVLNGNTDFVSRAQCYLSKLPVQKQIDNIVQALGERAAKIAEESGSLHNSESAQFNCRACCAETPMNWNYCPVCGRKLR